MVKKASLLDPWDSNIQDKYPGTKNTSDFDLWTVTPDGKQSEIRTEVDLISRRRAGGVCAFTLIEVLLVLALMGVLIGLVAVNAGAFIEASKYEPPARVLGKAVKDSFYFAETKRTAYLSYFEENATFSSPTPQERFWPITRFFKRRTWSN